MKSATNYSRCAFIVVGDKRVGPPPILRSWQSFWINRWGKEYKSVAEENKDHQVIDSANDFHLFNSCIYYETVNFNGQRKECAKYFPPSLPWPDWVSSCSFIVLTNVNKLYSTLCKVIRFKKGFNFMVTLHATPNFCFVSVRAFICLISKRTVRKYCLVI